MKLFTSNLLHIAFVMLPFASPIAYCLDGPSGEIHISGADSKLEENIQAHLTVGSEACNTSIERLERQQPEISKNILSAANALGYYHLEHQLSFTQESDCWQLEIEVEPGQRVIIRQSTVVIEGSPEVKAIFKQVVAQAPKVGAYLDHGQYEQIKSALSATAIENGFFAARFEKSEILINSKEHIADIAIRFLPGIQYLIGSIAINNQSPLRESFIRRLISIEEGSPYTSQTLFHIRDSLSSSSYFQTVSLDPGIRSAVSNRVPVIVSLVQKPRHKWGAGAGFTTDTGPRVRFSYDDRFVNAIGHQLETDLRISELRSEIDAAYRIPLKQPARQQLSLKAGALNEDNDSFSSDQYTLEASYNLKLLNGWHLTYFVNFQEDNYTLLDTTDTSIVTTTGMSITRSRSDNPVFPRNGWKVFAKLQGASDALLSDVSFMQLQASGEYIFSIGSTRVLGRAEVAATLVDEIEDLPASLRFFSGGDQTIRGYKYQSLGPLDTDGNVTGGAHLVNLSLETDFPIIENWRSALFIDSGNAFDDLNDLEIKTSVGLGLRWISPIGPIRFDIAHPLEDGGVRLHVTMGPDL